MKAIDENFSKAHLEFILCYNGAKNVIPPDNSPQSFYRYAKRAGRSEIRIVNLDTSCVKDFHSGEIPDFDNIFVKERLA